MTRRKRRPAHRADAPPAIPPEQRDKLLYEMRGGHDLEAAAATAGLTLEAIRADHELLGECAAAYRLGTSKLRAKMLEGALKGGDVHVLERAIAAREQAQREQFRAAVAGQHDGPDLDKLSVDQLLLVDAVLEGNFAALDRWVEQRARVLAAEALRRQPRREAAKPAPISGEVLPSEVLDPWQPVSRDRAVVPFRPARQVSTSRLMR